MNRTVSAITHVIQGWHIPISAQQCSARQASVTCDFDLYTNATDLTEDQKLAPNSSITGQLVFDSFLITASVSIVIAAALTVDKFLYHHWSGSDQKSITRHKHWLKVIHVAETLLVQMSDQQIASGMALLWSLNGQTCTVSAYDFNVVCTMLFISIVVHLNALVNTSDYVRKGKTAAFLRVGTIIAQLVFTGYVFAARDTPTWPYQPQSLAIMPAVCFENTNATAFNELYNFASNITNATTIAASDTNNGTATFFNSIKDQVGHNKGLGEYVPLALFVILAVILLLVEWLFSHGERVKHFRWSSIIASIISLIVSVAFVGYGGWRYFHLSSGMQIPAWYRSDLVAPPSFSQILPLALLAINVYQVFAAFSGPLPSGDRARRFVTDADEVREAAQANAQPLLGDKNAYNLQEYNVA